MDTAPRGARVGSNAGVRFHKVGVCRTHTHTRSHARDKLMALINIYLDQLYLIQGSIIIHAAHYDINTHTHKKKDELPSLFMLD